MKQGLYNVVFNVLNLYTKNKSIILKKRYDFLKSGNIIKIVFKKHSLNGLILRIKGNNYFNYTIKILVKVNNIFVVKLFFLFDDNIKNIICLFNNTKVFKAHLTFIESYFISKPKKNKKVLLNNRFKILINKLDKFNKIVN